MGAKSRWKFEDESYRIRSIGLFSPLIHCLKA